ncbi:MAG: hypothetical protein LBK97_00025 [Prevotellaceae bacterium]|jgi:hypothetical protein|nr:hypothetical protein [Prevotellaceae bacterium]
MKLFIITVILLALCIAGLGIRIWIKGEFTENEIERNKNMKRLGIKCVKNEERKQSDSENSDACAACSFLSSCDRKEDDSP